MSAYDLGTAKGTIVISAAQLGRASAALQSLGRNLTLVGVAAVGGFGYAINKAAEFEKRMSAVQAILGATDKAMERVRDKALQLGETTVFTSLEVGTAMEDLAKAGLTVEEIVGGAADATVMLAAAAGNIGLDRAAEIAANAMRTFSLEAKDMVHVADQLAGAANASTLEVEDLAVSMRYVGPVAAAAGQGIDDLSTALAILGDRGIKGSTAGTSMRGVLLSLSPTSDKARGALEELGIITEDGTNKFFDAAGNMKSLAEVAQVLQDHTRGLSQEQKIQAFNTIFQRRAMASALILADQGAAGFDRYSDAISKVSAAEVAAKKLDNLKGDILLLKAAVEAALIRAGAPFQEMLRGWVRGLTDLVKWFGGLSPRVQKFILGGLGLVGVLLTLAGVTALFLGSIFHMYRVFKDAVAAIRILAGAVRLLSATFLASPIFWVIAALVALGVALFLLYKKNEAFRNMVDKVWRAIRTFIVDAWNKHIYPALQAFWRWLSEDLPKAAQAAWTWIKKTWDSISKAVVGAWQDKIWPALQAIGSFLVTAAGYFVGFAKEVGKQAKLVWRWLNKHVFPVFVELGALVGAIVERIVQAWQFAWQFIQPTLVLIGDIISRTFRFIAETVKAAMGIVKGVWDAVWPAIQLVISVTLELIKSWISVFLGFVKAIWGPAWDFIKSYVSAVWEGIKGIVEGALRVIKGIIKVVTGIIKGDWKKVWEGIRDIFSGVWRAIQASLNAAWDVMYAAIQFGIGFVVNLFKEMPGRIVRAIGNLLTLLFDKGKDLLQGLWDGIQTIWTTVSKWLSDFKDLLLGFFKDALTWLYEVGKEVMQGLWDGLKWGWDKVTGWLSGLNPANWFNDINLKKGHAGKNLLGTGLAVMDGLYTGMQSGWDTIALWLRSLDPSTLVSLANLDATMGLRVNGLGSASYAAGAGVVSTQMGPSSEPVVHVVEKGDTIQIQAQTDANPREIVDEYLWAKRFRG